MFDFTTETILNDLSRVSVLTAATDPTLSGAEKALYVKRLNKFKSANVKSIHKSAGYQPVIEVGTIALPAAVVVGDVLRLNVDVALSGSEDASYSRWAVSKGKPFLAEYLVTVASSAVDTHGPLIAASVNKILKKDGISDIVVTYNAGTDTLVITCTNEYQRIASATFEKLNTTTDEFDVLTIGTILTAGKEGFGTSWFLTKNIRLPTIENIRFMGEFQDELPIANSLYNQYSFQFEAARNITGQGAVGQTMTSRTTHIFYVLTSVSAAFEAFITDGIGEDTIINAQDNVIVNPGV